MFMILLILIQRGKGGGLAGAFGGMGGQSAFGTKAGDAFTKITVVVAVFWFLLCISAILALKSSSVRRLKVGSGPSAASVTVPMEGASTAETENSDSGISSNSESTTAPASTPTPAE